jgi:hypothetical protein
LLGNILTITSDRLGASLAWNVVSVVRFSPSPGETTKAILMASVMAIAVVTTYNPTDFAPSLPNLLGSDKVLVPQIRETKTRGTTSIFKLAINIWPRVENIPSTRMLYVESSKPNIEKVKSPLSSNNNWRKTPVKIPAAMPINMRAVKLYLCADEDINVSCAFLYF